MSEELLGRLVLGVTMLVTGGLLWWMAGAAADGRLRRNNLAGVRLPSTLASDEAWLAGHRRAKRPTRIAAVCSLLAAVVCALPVPEPVVYVTVLGAAVPILRFVIYGAVVASRAAREAAQD